MGKLESNFKSSSQKLSKCHVGQEPAPGEPVQASSHSVPKHASLAAKPIGHLKFSVTVKSEATRGSTETELQKDGET